MRIRNHDVIGYIAPSMATDNEHSVVRIPADTREMLELDVEDQIIINGRPFVVAYARRADLNILVNQHYPQDNCVMFSAQHFTEELVDLRINELPFPNHQVAIDANGQIKHLIRCAPTRTNIPADKLYLPAAARRTLGVDLRQRVIIEGHELIVDRARRNDIEAIENEYGIRKSFMAFYYGEFGPPAVGHAVVEQATVEHTPTEPEINFDMIREKLTEVLGENYAPLFNVSIEDNEEGVGAGNEAVNRYKVDVTFTPDEFLGGATSESLKDAFGAALEELQGILGEEENALRNIQEKLSTVYEQIN